jgi:neutral ceramidase
MSVIASFHVAKLVESNTEKMKAMNLPLLLISSFLLFSASYPYPVQLWQLGDQLIFSLGGEVVIEYAIKLKEIYGQNIFVLGYSNDVMSYIPSSRILLEGGYEGERSQKTYGLPASWAPNIETKILNAFMELRNQEGFLLNDR